MHPSEMEMMKDLLKYVEMHQYIRKFIADTTNKPGRQKIGPWTFNSDRVF